MCGCCIFRQGRATCWQTLFCAHMCVCLWQIEFKSTPHIQVNASSQTHTHSFEISTILPQGARSSDPAPQAFYLLSAASWIITFQRRPLFFIFSHRQVAEMLFIMRYYLRVKFLRSASNVGATRKKAFNYTLVAAHWALPFCTGLGISRQQVMLLVSICKYLLRSWAIKSIPFKSTKPILRGAKFYLNAVQIRLYFVCRKADVCCHCEI